MTARRRIGVHPQLRPRPAFSYFTAQLDAYAALDAAGHAAIDRGDAVRLLQEES